MASGISLQEVKQTTELCRYCLMCRHVCPVTDVTRNEATSPHGWGILIASVQRGLAAWNNETVDVLYQCADCGLCQAHCVTDQPLPLAINASRAEVVEQQMAPAIIYELRDKLQKWGNPYAAPPPERVSVQSDAALIIGMAEYLEPQAVAAAVKLLAVAGVEAMPVAICRESAYFPNTLGLVDEARRLGQDTLDEIKQVGAKKVFVLSPGDVYTYQTIYGYLGLQWPDDLEIVEVTTFLAAQLEAGQLSFKTDTFSDYTFYDPDHTVRLPGRWAAPRKLLSAISQTPPIELFWRKERAAPCGVSGGLSFVQPELAAHLAQARLDEARQRQVKTIITDDPLTLHHLKQQTQNGNSDVAISGLYELLIAHLST